MTLMTQITSVLPAFSMSGILKFVGYFFIFLIFIVVASCLFGVWLWWYMNKKRYKIIIKKFEKVNGVFILTGTEQAAERRIGKSGDTVFYWKQSKSIRPRGEQQSGINTYYYGKREDGEWENFALDDLDFKLRLMNVKFTPVELRYAKESLRTMVNEIYSSEKWWQKWQGVIISVVFIVLVSLMLGYIAVKIGSITGSLQSAISSLTPILETLNKILSSMDNVCSNSGIVR